MMMQMLAAGGLAPLSDGRREADQGNPRSKVILPDTAHGTNPASLTLAGYDAVEIPSGPDGRVDVGALERAVDTEGVPSFVVSPDAKSTDPLRYYRIAPDTYLLFGNVAEVDETSTQGPTATALASSLVDRLRSEGASMTDELQRRLLAASPEREPGLVGDLVAAALGLASDKEASLLIELDVSARLRKVQPGSDVLEVLYSSAQDLGPPGRDEIYGYGLLRPAS